MRIGVEIGDTASGRRSMLTFSTVLAFLVVAHAQPEIPPPSSSPLIQALIENDVIKAQQLLDSGADPDAWDVITPLYAAQEYVRSSRQRHAIMKRLLEKGASVDRPTSDGSTTLMLAASEGDMRSAQLLLDHGADPLRTNEQGYSSIGSAYFSEQPDLASMLQDHVGESGLRQAAAQHEADGRGDEL